MALVLHINPTIDCAGVSWNLCSALNKHTKIQCTHIIGEKHPFGYKYGLLFGKDINTNELEELVRQADILHFNHMDYLEPSFGIDWKKYLGRKIFVYHSHSGWEEGKEYNHIYKLGQLFNRYQSADATLVCNSANIKIFKNSQWIPNVLPDCETEYKRDFSAKLKVGHFASNSKYKDVDVMKKLMQKLGEIADYNLVMNFCDRERLLKMMSKNHILFDNIWQGYFGMTTLEAMQRGVVPITKSVEKSYNAYCEKLGCNEIPIIRVEGMKGVEEVIKCLDSDRKLLEDKSNECKKWINNYYSEKKIVGIWEEFYNGLL